MNDFDLASYLEDKKNKEKSAKMDETSPKTNKKSKANKKYSRKNMAKKSKSKGSKKLSHYEPSSDEIRAAYYMLTHKTIRGKNVEIQQALQDLIKNWEL